MILLLHGLLSANWAAGLLQVIKTWAGPVNGFSHKFLMGSS
jgi:hypothetical protein